MPNEYQLLDSTTGRTIAMGTKEQMFSFVKHHVPDGRYRLVGPDLKIHCVRQDGVVSPDPDGVVVEGKEIQTVGQLIEE